MRPAPAAFSTLPISSTCGFERRSASGPTHGASTTNATRKRALQRRHVPRAARRFDQHRNRREQERVVGERRQELRAEQNPDAAAHGTAPLAARQRGFDERVHGRIVGLAAAEQRNRRDRHDALRHVQLAHAVGARLRRKLGAVRVGARRHEDQLLALLGIRQADARVLRPGPRARRKLLDGRQRDHLAADLREPLGSALDRDETVGVDRDDVARVVPTGPALRRRRLDDARAGRAAGTRA